jgi:PAS domain S-box-containing protein
MYTSIVLAFLIFSALQVWYVRSKLSSIKRKYQTIENESCTTALLAMEEKMNDANRRFVFISQINQIIVQAKVESEVFSEACRIAMAYGNFQMAWIGRYDSEIYTISVTESSGNDTTALADFKNGEIDKNGPIFKVLQTGQPFVCNEISTLHLSRQKEFAAINGLQSFMILPIKKNEVVIGTFNLYASKCNVFDQQEAKLLTDIADHISFALAVFEKERLRLKAEMKYLHSELRLNQGQSIAHVGSFEIDFSTGISTWSEELCRIYGFDITDNKHPYNDWLKMVHPDDIQEVMAVINEVKISLSSSAIYHRIIRLDGTIRHIFSQGEYDLDSGGNLKGMHGVAHDITVIKESERARNQSEHNLQLIMDLIPQGIFIKDIQGKYLFVNKSFAMGYGLSPQEFLSNPKYQTMEVEEEQKIVMAQDQEVIQTGASLTIPELQFTAGGITRYFYTVKIPYTLSGSNETNMLGIALDITDQKNANVERTKMISDLMKRNKDLEQFSYVVSHNVRAPLVNIISLISLLDTKSMGKQYKELLSALTISTNKLDSVIQDLNFILNMNHEINEVKQYIDFEKLVNDIKISISDLIINSGVTIISDFSAVDHTFCFKSYMHSIFHNLILNGIKYRRPNIASLIHITSKLVDHKMIIEFSDNGLGMDLERHGSQLFGLYKRFHPEIEGKGLGLYMVKMQLEQINGHISVHSKIGEGTTFIIELASRLHHGSAE